MVDGPVWQHRAGRLQGRGWIISTSKAGLALVLSLIGAGGVWFCRRFRFVALAIALVTAGASTLILIGGEVEARGRLNNFGPELEAVNEFIPPRAAELVSTKTTASSQPIVSRYWQIPGSFGEVEAASRRSFETWADPGTVMAPTTLSSPEELILRAARGEQRGTMVVIVDSDRPGTVSLTLYVKRGEFAA